MRVLFPATLLLAVALVTGCTGDDEADPTPRSGASTSPSATETAPDPTPEPTGARVERPAYTFHLPVGWEDTTDERAYVPEENTFYGGEAMSDVFAGLVTIDYASDTPYDSIQDRAKSALDAYAVRNPAIKRVKDTTWAGEPSLHAVGPGSGPDTTFQGFYMLHNGDSIEVMIQTRGGRKASQKVADQIESTWEWK